MLFCLRPYQGVRRITCPTGPLSVKSEYQTLEVPSPNTTLPATFQCTYTLESPDETTFTVTSVSFNIASSSNCNERYMEISTNQRPNFGVGKKYCGIQGFTSTTSGLDRIYIHVVGTGFTSNDRFVVKYKSGRWIPTVD
ncbi:hypothetical protein FBUS_02350 [Fasciolopsis buskii]|uniref:CUB domain-containing protein n=1 Tax=Fasciolopsis buskii TaxID=27845 RepID=A0A8E0RQL5_9TREM|nr:hypothetical protein FBUS_02350 [Fasciolopsis buski]